MGSMKNGFDEPESRTVQLKLKSEVLRIKQVCREIAAILYSLKDYIQEGRTTLEIEERAVSLMIKSGLITAGFGYEGFPAKICTSINNVAAHGIPCDYLLCENDVLTIDIVARRGEWHGDAAWTYIVGKGSPDTRRLIKAAWQSTMAGIHAAKAGSRLGDIGAAIERTAKNYGCSVIPNCVGHGIGRNLHEEPSVLPQGEPGTDRPVVPGMVITVEPVLSLGEGIVRSDKQNIQLLSIDGSLTAQFEHTIAIFSEHTEILSQNGNIEQKYLDFPPYF